MVGFALRWLVFLGALSSPVFAQTPFGLGDLERLLIDQQPQKLEELLAHLPDRWLTRYVLMKQSRSAQGASAENPRVILYGDGNLLLAFNGSPDQRGYENLEIIEYHPSRGEYEFRVVDFSQGTGQLSAPNPNRCTLCHQNPLRPNWEPYPFWPGAVGENDTVTPEEVAYLKDFAVRGALNARYRHLKRQENLEEIQKQILKFTPAMHLNTELTQQKSHRIAVQSRRTPEYEKFRWSLLGALLDCDNVASFIPEGILSGGRWEWERMYEDLVERTAKTPVQHRRLVDPIENRVVANLRYLFETRRLKISPWFYSFEFPYLFTTVSVVDALGTARHLMDNDPQLKQLAFPGSAFHRHFSRLGFPSLYEPADAQAVKGFCTQLRFKSLTAFYQ